jgi:hypothetical protein
MEFKRSRISRFACIALCGVGLFAQTSALKASEDLREEVPIISATQAQEEVNVLADHAPLPIELLPAVSDLTLLKDLCKSFETQEDFGQLKVDINKAIELIVKSPLSVADRSDALGMSMVRALQKIENIRMYDLGDLVESHATVAPHASDYYGLLPAQLLPDNPNKEYYQWLVQAIYTAEKCLENSLVTAEDLKAGYVSYLVTGAKVYAWLYNETVSVTVDSFNRMLDFLAKDTNLFNQFQTTSFYQKEKQRELDEDISSHLMLTMGVKLNKTDLNFIVFDNQGNGECGWYGMGLTYEKALQTFNAAIDDKRIYNGENYYPLSRRFMAVEGDLNVIKDRIKRIDKHFIDITTDQDSKDPFASHDAAFRSSDEFLKPVREKIELIKEELKQKKEDHLKNAPYLNEIGAQPENTEVLSSWNTQRNEWIQNHQEEFDTWNEENVKLDMKYEEDYFSTFYEKIFRLSVCSVAPQTIANFISSDFTRVFPDKFLELDPLGKNQSMIYVDMLLRLNRLNIYLWMFSADPYFTQHKAECFVEGSPISLAKSFGGGVATTRDFHLLLVRLGNNSGHYLKLVAEKNSVGRMNAIRHEKLFGLSKMPLKFVSAKADSSEQKDSSLPAIPEGERESVSSDGDNERVQNSPTES